MPPRKVFYSNFAEQDIEELSDYGFLAHGRDSVIRYNKLIQYAIDQLREAPDLQDTKPYLYDIRRVHLKKYKKQVAYEGITVQSPSHYVFYRLLPDESLQIVRIIREGRSFEPLLREEF